MCFNQSSAIRIRELFKTHGLYFYRHLKGMNKAFAELMSYMLGTYVLNPLLVCKDDLVD